MITEIIQSRATKALGIVRNSARNVVKHSGNELERTPLTDWVSLSLANKNYKTIECKPTLFKQKALAETDLKSIHESILEAFSPLLDIKDPDDMRYLYFNCFKSDVNSFLGRAKGIRHYAIKNNEDKVVGFYQLQKQKDSLYVMSLVIPKEFRNTKESPAIFRCAAANILKRASELGHEKISLQMDARNDRLFEHYENMGFKLKRTEENFFAGKFPAHYMEANLSEINNNLLCKK